MPERSTGAMMFIGERCALTDCHREDFLPFRCDCCKESYCSSHFRPTSHQCSKYDEAGGDYMVPLCPLCDSPPEGWKRDEDPNVAMDRHISAGRCPALDSNGLVKPKSIRTKKQNECSFQKCSKTMVVPIQCPQCRVSFCPSHRAPPQHSCGFSPAASSARLFNGDSNSKTSPASSPFKKLAKSASIEKSTSQEPNSATSTSVGEKLFNKTPKRAKAERISAIKAMQSRQKKGLLTSAEETKLAEEMASMAKISGGKKDSDCIIC